MLAKIGNACLLLFFVLLIALNIRALIGVVGSGAIAVALFYIIGLFIPAWLLAGPKLEVRSVIALGTAARNFGAALVPTATSFHEPAVTMMLIVSAIIGLAILFIARLGCGEEWVHPKLEGKMTPKLKHDSSMNKGLTNENVNRGNRATIVKKGKI